MLKRAIFLPEMKDQGIFQVNWIISDENEVGFFTKNLSSSFFEKHHVNSNGEG